ncbi:MAG: DUF2142 domain-containing protein [Anaerolineae bacterium]|nr:DUF2142 domain-containing protein [Anaerolineae bacterium]
MKAIRVPSRLIRVLPVVLYVFLSTSYLFTIPTGESPDEPSHLQCIEQVTQHNRIPIIDPLPGGDIWWARERIISGLVCAHMPLYYFLTGYTQRIVQRISGVPTHYEFPPNDPEWETGQSKAMFTHPHRDSFLTLSEPASLLILRIESMLLGLVSVLGAYQITRRIAPNSSHAATIAMTLVAGWPQFLFMSRAISNDALAVALAVGVLIVLLEIGKPYRFVLASVLAALATLSKLTMVFSAGTIVLAFALEFAASRERSAYLRAGIVSVGVFGSLGALLFLQPTLLSHLEWSRATMAGINPAVCTVTYWLDVLHASVQSGWARFGWMNVLTPDVQAYTWWSAIVLTGAAGVYAGIHRSSSRKTRLAVIVACVWLLSFLLAYLRINMNRFQPQFRYIFPIAPVLAAFSATGLSVIGRPFERLKPVAVPVVAVFLLLANLWIIFNVVVPAYS